MYTELYCIKAGEMCSSSIPKLVRWMVLVCKSCLDGWSIPELVLWRAAGSRKEVILPDCRTGSWGKQLGVWWSEGPTSVAEGRGCALSKITTAKRWRWDSSPRIFTLLSILNNTSKGESSQNQRSRKWCQAMGINLFFCVFFWCSEEHYIVFDNTVSGCDCGNRTRNIVMYIHICTWRFSILSYNRHPYWATTVTLLSYNRHPTELQLSPMGMGINVLVWVSSLISF